MSEFRLPRLRSNFPIAGPDGKPSLEFHRWWQSVVEEIEEQESLQDQALIDIQTALTNAGIALAAAKLDLVGPSTATIEAETDGTVVGGELPANYVFVLESDGSTVSADSWSASVISGTATVSIAGGVLEVSALTSNNATIKVSATYNNITRAVYIKVTKRLASVDINTSSTGGTTITDNSFDAITSTSYVAVSDTLTVNTGTSGVVKLYGPTDLGVPSSSTDGSYSATAIWQQDISGTWTDVGSSATATATVEFGSVQKGSLLLYTELTLTASTSYSFRLMAKADAADGVSRYLTGTASASGE